MFSTPFYHSLLRKYVILVGTLFNNIHITRTDSTGAETSLIRVPIMYAPKDKMLTRVLQDPNIDRPTSTIPLPAITFEMGKLYYDADRKLRTTGRSTIINADNEYKYQYNPVPYNIDFKVYVYAKQIEDGNKIIEQVLPFFTPDWTTTIELIPEMEETKDIPVVLRNISFTDSYDGDFTKRRAIIWTLDLTLKGYLYGPVKKSGVIKFTTVNFYTPNTAVLDDAVGVTDVAERITVQPGLTANGTPTSNINNTVAYTEINVDDDYGYITQIYNQEDILNE